MTLLSTNLSAADRLTQIGRDLDVIPVSVVD